MVYKLRRKSYKSYAKKGISKVVVKTLIIKSMDWGYFIRNEYAASSNDYRFISLINKDWTETGKTVLKHL